jgi:hypothetical protein
MSDREVRTCGLEVELLQANLKQDSGNIRSIDLGASPKPSGRLTFTHILFLLHPSVTIAPIPPTFISGHLPSTFLLLIRLHRTLTIESTHHSWLPGRVLLCPSSLEPFDAGRPTFPYLHFEVHIESKLPDFQKSHLRRRDGLV